MHQCRFCSTPLEEIFVDLGTAPLSNAYLREEDLARAETYYPQSVFICGQCLLVQLPAYVDPGDIFSEYAYFSSYSQSWLEHARTMCDTLIKDFDLSTGQHIVEVAGNDGYLLRWFLEKGFPVLNIDPAANVAKVAEAAGIPTEVTFFGEASAKRLKAAGKSADVLIGNNVFAHVPDLNDFCKGLEILLKPDGFICLEFPHLLQLIEHNQFDTIYHEHFSYFSLSTVRTIFDYHGLQLFDARQVPTHGGSLRVFAAKKAAGRSCSQAAKAILDEEQAKGLTALEYYGTFKNKPFQAKCELLEFLLSAKKKGLKVAAYGAPAKGNTLLNYCGIGADLLPFTVDRNPYKQGRYLPGSRIPIHAPEALDHYRPAILLILPWNIQTEIIEQNQFIRDWGGRFAVAIPSFQIID